MKKIEYKIHEQYPYNNGFWTRPDPPKGYRIARTCRNCAKCSLASTGGPFEVSSYLCNEVTEYTGLWGNGNPRGYSRQPFYTNVNATCDAHKFEHEMEAESR